MIRNFSDHAANERTFLAWVRTAIAVMAFGFLVERFDLLIAFEHVTLGGRPVPRAGLGAGGLWLMGAGLAVICLALIRFVRTSRRIDEDERHEGGGLGLDLALALTLLLAGSGLLAYLMFGGVGAL